MTTEELEKKYATGEWIIIIQEDDNSWHEFTYSLDLAIKHDLTYKLIHKKDSEVLDHVLNGGVVRCIQDFEVPPIIYEYDLHKFVESYNVDFFYEVIKDKPNLNGHYCLATKEHYDKLINDGYENAPRENDLALYNWIVLHAWSNQIHLYSGNEPTAEYRMHLYNNEWVFGSLEHDNRPYREDCKVCKGKGINHGVQRKPNKWSSEPCTACKNESKPVERITREEAHKEVQYDFTTDSYIHGVIDKLFDYIEYLEANQSNYNETALWYIEQSEHQDNPPEENQKEK